MGLLYQLEIDNFKSYRGKVVIGPFKQFTAIIGPNGSGKSNTMDAISFVLGEKTSNLRVRKLADLIHGAPINKPVAKSCSVTMVYQMSEAERNAVQLPGDEPDSGGSRRSSRRRQGDLTVRFSRFVTSAGSEFKINDVQVPPPTYHETLQSLGIFIKAKNFLVYQGQIEQVAMKTPKERTAFFEELSRSIEYAQEYEALEKQLQKATADASENQQRRRGVAQEKKEAKMEKEDADRYARLKDEVEQARLRATLFELRLADDEIQHQKEEGQKLENELREKMKDKRAKDDNASASTAMNRDTVRQIAAQEREVERTRRALNEAKQPYNTVRQEVIHIQRKLDQQNRAAEASQRQADIEEEKAKAIEKKIEELEKQRSDEQQKLSEGSGQQVTEEMLRDYFRCKQQALGASSAVDLQLSRLRQELKTENDALEHALRRQQQIDERFDAKNDELRCLNQQLERLINELSLRKSRMERENEELKTMETEAQSTSDEVQELTEKISQLESRLAEIAVDNAESERTRRRNDALENLMRVFPEKVYGRFTDLFKPTQNQYKVAVTKLLMRHMQDIVCDTTETANEAVAYLKEQRFAAETFLPLNSLHVPPLNEQLRNVKERKNVKLAYDVIKVVDERSLPSEVRKAVQFVCANAVVCDDTAIARYMAYEHTERPRAVALDGTLFQSNGVISGGGAELRARAQKWDDGEAKKLKKQRAALCEAFQNATARRRRMGDVDAKKSAINQLQTTIYAMEAEQNRYQNESVQRCTAAIEELSNQSEEMKVRIANCRANVDDLNQKIDEHEKKREPLIREQFAEFCKKHNFSNVLEFETKSLNKHEEQRSVVQNLDEKLTRMRNELAFSKQRVNEAANGDATKKIEIMTRALTKAKEGEKQKKSALEKVENDMKAQEEKLQSMREEAEKKDSLVTEARRIAQEASREVMRIEKSVAQAKQRLVQLELRRHTLLHEAKVAGVDVPFASGGRIEDVPPPGDPSLDDASSSQSYNTVSSMEVDYDLIEQDLKKAKTTNARRDRLSGLKTEAQQKATQLARLPPPNQRTDNKMDEAKQKERKVQSELEVVNQRVVKLKREFEKVKRARYDAFIKLFGPVADKLDEIYKSLTRHLSAQATLICDNTEEPYLDGVQYNCVAPGKRYRQMDSLSGGEKTVAALALLFAIHQANKAPFFVLDEIDAALDNTNISKVATFIQQLAASSEHTTQLIVISLKEEFYNKADALIGVFPQPSACTVSGIVTLDLTPYKAQVAASDSAEHP